MLSSDFINSLSEEEMGMLLYFVNVASRPLSHKIQFEINDLKFFRKDVLAQNLVSSFDKLTPEGHPTFISLMEKFGVKVEIKKEEPKKIEEPIIEISPPEIGNIDTSGSIPMVNVIPDVEIVPDPATTQSAEVPKIEPTITGSSEVKV